MRESDIRARLGRLPQGLTGVYDEIVSSIKSQPDCNVDLAIRALQWMLVSECPLQPGVLVAAAQVNPSTPVPLDSSLESVLAVDLLIQSCKGLLLLDSTLGVVRFSHLSVQEYLETQNKTWDIGFVGAQLFVSESCLWILQYGYSLSSPLYNYAARNWFKHCRSYQDLMLSRGSIKDTKHELSILLLNSFLGSFKQPSASYVKWADSLCETSNTNETASSMCVRSMPAFSAAFAGLGELVSWLWHMDGSDMEIKHNGLLDVAWMLLAAMEQHGS